MGFRLEKKSRPENQAMGATAETGGDTVRISFRMSKHIHKRLKLEAVRQGRTIVGMLEGFVTEHTLTE